MSRRKSSTSVNGISASNVTVVSLSDSASKPCASCCSSSSPGSGCTSRAPSFFAAKNPSPLFDRRVPPTPQRDPAYNRVKRARTFVRVAKFWTVTTPRTAALEDVQARRPSTHLSLTRVGVTGVEKVVRISAEDSPPQLFYAQLECFVDLDPKQ